MRIEIIKSKETSLVIDDIGKAIEEGDILKEGYLKAIHALQRYLDQSRLIRDELKNARERGTDSQINDILYRSPQNIIAFSGKRGTGKTSAMISFTEFLRCRGEMSQESREYWNEYFVNLHTLVLSPIDPTMLENDQDILSVVLSRLLYKAEERWDSALNPDFHRGYQKLEGKKNDLLQKASACLKGIQAIKKNGKIEDLADLQRVGDSAVLKKNLFDLVNHVNAFCLKDDDAVNKSMYLVIPIDDTDCQILKAHDVMEDIRRYLTLPNVIILMATDGDMLRTVFAQHYANAFETGLKNKYLESADMGPYAEKYLTKMIPSTHRVFMPVFENVLKDNSVNLELGYYANPDKKEDLIIKSFSASGDSEAVVYDFQSKVLKYIFIKTGIVFVAHTDYLNNIIPTTLRGLAHLLNFLQTMEDPEQIDPSRKYTPPELKEALNGRLKTLERNLDQFEEYFMNEWVPAKVPGDMMKILRGIEEQVPANIVHYAYDEMYDKYFEDHTYTRETTPTYYNLMEMMGAINNTIDDADILKTYKTKTDFYNVFAVRSLLTIKNNKKQVSIIKQALLDLSLDGNKELPTQYSLDLKQFGFPQSIREFNLNNSNSKKCYTKKLTPVTTLAWDILQGKGPQSSVATQEVLYCRQEIAWLIVSNWDLQDAIYKAIKEYIGRTDSAERTVEGVWKEIHDSLAQKNCNMLKKLIEKGWQDTNEDIEYYENSLNALLKEDDESTPKDTDNANLSSDYSRKVQETVINSIYTNAEDINSKLKQNSEDITAEDITLVLNNPAFQAQLHDLIHYLNEIKAGKTEVRLGEFIPIADRMLDILIDEGETVIKDLSGMSESEMLESASRMRKRILELTDKIQKSPLTEKPKAE